VRLKLVFALAWASFAAWCVAGFPPCVDLPAHGAQLESLANLLRGDALVAQFYEVKVPLGYGLTYWLFLPLALVTNGGVAIRAALWVTLLLYPLSAWALMRAFRRPDWYVALSLPLAFNISYWYGLLPGLFAQPMIFFAVAAYARALEQPRAKWLVLLNLAAAAAMLSHLLAFAAAAMILFAWALARPSRWASLRTLALGFALPAALAIPKIYSMAYRAVTPGDWPATEYAAKSHLAWFFENYRPEGVLAAACPLLVSAVFVAVWLRRRRVEPLGPAVLFGAMLLIYLVTPKTLSGIFLISVRLPVLAGMLALLLVDEAAFPRWLRVGMLTVCVASLGESAAWHWRFARAVDGLEQMVDQPPPDRHGYVSLVGRELLRSKQVYLDHLGQWWTAKYGKVGHNFFADADHHPVRFREGVAVPGDLWDFQPEQLAFFEELLVYGEVPLPEALSKWTVVEQAGKWRRLRR
jgi:hypothetical protein